MKVIALCVAASLIITKAAYSEPPTDQPAAAQTGATEQKEPAAAVQSAAGDFISLLQQGKFDDAVKRFDATMQKALPVAQLQTVWQATIKANGKFQNAGASRVNRVDKWDVVDTPCAFEKSTLVIRISLNEQREIGGLFLLTPSQKSPNKDEPEVELKTATGTLYGTLNLPTSKGPCPVVLIIAGSGPTDRDGNQPFMKNDSLQMVGKALAAHGVAALRYDKRGIAKSAAAGAEEEKLRLENYVDDAIGWVKQLRGDARFNNVMVLGHSEGSLIGILVARREPIDALISVAGAGRDLATLLRDQLKSNLPAELYEPASHIIDELVAGRKVDDVPAVLTTLFRPSVQPFLMTWLKYDPAKEIAGVTIPILIVQGTTDMQVSLDDAKLLAAANKNAQPVTIENMNHVLKQAPEKSLASQVAIYSDPTLPLAPHFMDEILSFLQRIKATDAPPAGSR